MTPLHYACEAGQLPTVRALVAAGARVNDLARVCSAGPFTTVEVQASPLACAARLGHAEVVAFLLESGADPNLGDDSDPVRSYAWMCGGCGRQLHG